MTRKARLLVVVAVGTAVWTPTSFAWQLPLIGKKKEPPTPPSQTVAYWTEKVAEVNGEPITRADLADELIGTYGAKQVDLLINRKLIEQACKAKKIDIGRDDLEAELQATLTRLNIKREEFVKRVLAQREMTFAQYMRDTVWPKVALQKLVADKVKVTPDELQKSFEANYGEKRDIRMLVVKEMKKAQDLWKKVDEEKDVEKRVKLFEDICKTHSIDEATRPFMGRCQPIGRFSTFGKIEDDAMRLKPGEVSGIIQIQEGFMMMLCVAHIPPVKNINFDTRLSEKTSQTVKDYLTADLYEKKQKVEIANAFRALREHAKVQDYFKMEFEASALAPADASKRPRTENRAN